MSGSQWLLVVTVFLSLCGVGQVWLVQLSVYSLWPYVGAREFPAYHSAWWRSIWGVILVPAGLVFVAAILMLWIRPDGVPAWALWCGLFLELMLVLGTAVWWGPLMARLAEPETGLILPRYRQLMWSHWIRVALATSYGLLALWMLLKSFGVIGRA